MARGDGLVEPSLPEQLQGLLVVDRTLARWDKDEVTVLVGNHSDSEHHIQAGTALGKCDEVEQARKTAIDVPV